MLGDERCQVGTAHFFFAFEQEGHIAGEFTGYREPRFERQQLGKVLALVVTGTTPVDAPIAYRRFERRRHPGFERIRWLHIIVSIKQHRRLTRFVVMTTDNHGPAGGGVCSRIEPQ